MDEFQKKLDAASEWLRSEYVSIRTGQASPNLLDGVKVDSYGAKVAINQVASVGIEDARTLRISPWDSDSISQIERAVLDADLGVGVSTDSTGLRVSFPELTGERREQLLKISKQKLEEARVRVRNARDERMKGIETKSKAKEMGEDEARREKEKVQKQVDETNKKLEVLYVQKETEINR